MARPSGSPLTGQRRTVDHAEQRSAPRVRELRRSRRRRPGSAAGGRRGRARRCGGRRRRSRTPPRRRRPAAALAPHRAVERGERRLGIGAGERQRTPARAQRRAQRRGVGPVADHVADDDGDPPVVELDGVVEVTADQHPVLARAVEAADDGIGRGQAHAWQQLSLEALVEARLRRSVGVAVERQRERDEGDREQQRERDDEQPDAADVGERGAGADVGSHDPADRRHRLEGRDHLLAVDRRLAHRRLALQRRRDGRVREARVQLLVLDARAGDDDAAPDPSPSPSCRGRARTPR